MCDWLRTMAVCYDEYFQIPITRYSREGAWWFSDADPIGMAQSIPVVLGGMIAVHAEMLQHESEAVPVWVQIEVPNGEFLSGPVVRLP